MTDAPVPGATGGTSGPGVPAARTTEPDTLEYHQLFRAGREPVQGWSLLGIFAVAMLFLVVNAVVVLVGFVAYWLATGVPTDQLDARMTALSDTDHATPSVLLFINLVLALAIPGVWAVTRGLNGLQPRWLASVAPRIRWRWLAASFGVSLVSLLVAVVLGAFLPATGEADTGGGLNDFTSTTRDFLLVVVLLTPLQAIAEEYLFRGYLTQAFGSLVADRRVSRALAVAVPALLFALAHGAQSVPIFVDRLAFGVVAGILVIATGGLEAGIAYHVVNNLLAFGLALAFGDMSTTLSPEGGTWWDVLLSIVKSVLFVALSIWVARRMGVQTRVGRTELERSAARV